MVVAEDEKDSATRASDGVIKRVVEWAIENFLYRQLTRSLRGNVGSEGSYPLRTLQGTVLGRRYANDSAGVSGCK